MGGFPRARLYRIPARVEGGGDPLVGSAGPAPLHVWGMAGVAVPRAIAMYGCGSSVLVRWPGLAGVLPGLHRWSFNGSTVGLTIRSVRGLPDEDYEKWLLIVTSCQDPPCLDVVRAVDVVGMTGLSSGSGGLRYLNGAPQRLNWLPRCPREHNTLRRGNLCGSVSRTVFTAGHSSKLKATKLSGPVGSPDRGCGPPCNGRL
jgi:hypothetical protein